MHILLEVIFPFHMNQLLNYVFQSNLLSISQINSRILSYSYAYYEEQPSPLSGINLQGTQSG